MNINFNSNDKVYYVIDEITSLNIPKYKIIKGIIKKSLYGVLSVYTGKNTSIACTNKSMLFKSKRKAKEKVTELYNITINKLEHDINEICEQKKFIENY